MKENWKKLVDLGLRTSRVFTDNAMNVYSGYTAFYILMSLIPLFFLAVSAINLISEEYMAGFAEILATIFPSVPQVQSLLNNTIQNLRGSTNALVISVSALSLLWSAAARPEPHLRREPVADQAAGIQPSVYVRVHCADPAADHLPRLPQLD